MAGRVTQESVEVLTQPSTQNARITQESVEVLVREYNDVYITQLVAELLYTNNDNQVAITQFLTEVFTSNSAPETPPTETQTPDETQSNDTYMSEGTPDTTYEADGQIVVDATSGNKKHAILKFDLSDLIGKTVESVKLRLYLLNYNDRANYSVRRVLPANSDWVEGETTWNNKKNGKPWAGQPGASQDDVDISSTPMWGPKGLGNEQKGFKYFDLELTEFGEMVLSNNGMLIKPEETKNAKIIFYDASAPDTTSRPTLLVTFSEPPIPPGPSGTTTKQSRNTISITLGF